MPVDRSVAARRAWSEPTRVLRRLEKVAAGYGIALAFALYLLRGSAAAALVLTLTAAVSIVAFRGLQGLVGQLQAGPERSEASTSDSRKPSARGRRRLVWLRFSLLTLAPLVSLWLDSGRALALVLGFSVLPLAIMTEGLLQLIFVLVEHDHGS